MPHDLERPGQARSGSPLQGAPVDAAGARSNLLFLPAIALAVTSLWSGPVGLLLGLAGAGVLTLAAWLLREGLRAEAAFHARSAARRPALPRKMLSSALTGAGVTLAALSHGQDLVGGVLYGIAAGGLHLAAFGADPLRDKFAPDVDAFQHDRVTRVVADAEGHLTAMQDAVALLRDRALEGRVAHFTATARRMIRTVEEDPRDLAAARKYLGVYLQGAREATAKFADLHARRPDPVARASYEALLDDLEANFASRTDQMLENDRSDMEVEIKVLRDRLQREGV